MLPATFCEKRCRRFAVSIWRVWAKELVAAGGAAAALAAIIGACATSLADSTRVSSARFFASSAAAPGAISAVFASSFLANRSTIAASSERNGAFESAGADSAGCMAITFPPAIFDSVRNQTTDATTSAAATAVARESCGQKAGEPTASPLRFDRLMLSCDFIMQSRPHRIRHLLDQRRTRRVAHARTPRAVPQLAFSVRTA